MIVNVSMWKLEYNEIKPCQVKKLDSYLEKNNIYLLNKK